MPDKSIPHPCPCMFVYDRCQYPERHLSPEQRDRVASVENDFCGEHEPKESEGD